MGQQHVWAARSRQQPRHRPSADKGAFTRSSWSHVYLFLDMLILFFFLHKFAVCTLAVRRSSGLGRVCRSEPLPPPGGWRLRPAGPVVLWPAARAKAAAESKLVPAVTQQSGELRSQTHPPAPLLGGSYIRKHKPWFSFSRTDIEEEEG